MTSRLRTLRLARGFTLDVLAERMGGMVTKMSLSRYERELFTPPPPVLERLARELGVTTDELLGKPSISVQFLQWRRRATLTAKDENRLLERARLLTEERYRLQDTAAPGERPDLPRRFPVESLWDVELAAEDLRRRWNLGHAPIRHLTDELESRLIHVLEMDGPEEFDGVSAVVEQADSGSCLSAAVVVRRGVGGERQRMTIAHELGHLVLAPAGELDEEVVAFRFASALLVPASELRAVVGRTRDDLTYEELQLLRARFGVTMQALVFRMQSLGIISQSQAREWWKFFSRHGWRRQEEGEAPPEQSLWVRRMLLRAIQRGVMTAESATQYLVPGESLTVTGPRRTGAEVTESEEGLEAEEPEFAGV